MWDIIQYKCQFFWHVELNGIPHRIHIRHYIKCYSSTTIVLCTYRSNSIVGHSSHQLVSISFKREYVRVFN